MSDDEKTQFKSISLLGISLGVIANALYFLGLKISELLESAKHHTCISSEIVSQQRLR